MAIKAAAFAAKCHELVSFLVDVLRRDAGRGALRRRRDLSRFLLGPARTRRRDAAAPAARRVAGLRLAELRNPMSAAASAARSRSNTATFPTPSSRSKSANIDASGADTLLAGDLGCLMNMAGKLQREGRAVKVRHVAEVLAGMTDEPAIGEPARRAARVSCRRRRPRRISRTTSTTRSPTRRCKARCRMHAISSPPAPPPPRGCPSSRRCATARARSRITRSRISISISRPSSARSPRAAATCITRATRRRRAR